jgi:hypothetical protein
MYKAPEFLVNFVIGGTQKGGTTALAHFLGQHPEICLPINKESHFFDAPDFSEVASEDQWQKTYRATFPAETGARLFGDATPIYMYLPEVAGRVRHYNRAMRWILLLRDPVERAVSHYRMEYARGNETFSFEEALRLEPKRLWRDSRNRSWKSSVRCHSYINRGFYSRQIRWLRRLFPREQILILTSDQLRDRHEETLLRVYEFLRVPRPDVLPPPETIFATPDPAAPVSSHTLERLRGAYLQEVRHLEELLQRPLNAWRGENR